MTKINDLEKCNYFPLDCDNLVSVGWLSKGSEFNKGAVNKEFFDRLCELLIDPWQPVVCMGTHPCGLCQFDAPQFSKNLFIPYEGKIYVCPEAITHYIASHWYKPPQIFIDAVMNCPDIRTMEYKKAILANGGRGLTKPLG